MKPRLLCLTTTVATLTGILVAGCSTAPEQPDVVRRVSTDVQWTACPDGAEDSKGGPRQLQCAKIQVPRDYNDPEGVKIDLAISKLASKNLDKRRGILMLNPGGPGGTGLDQPEFLVKQGISQEVLDTYDLIGIDTRGVGHSTRISCGFTDDLGYLGAVPPYAYDDAAFDEQAALSEEVARRCAEDPLVPYVSTANMSRDMNRVRQSLGEEKASFLGYSYGSALGAAYASMYPDTADRIVIDSNIGDTHLDYEGIRNYALGMEDAFPDFAKWAADRSDRFGLGNTPAEVRDTYFELADKLDHDVVDGLDGRLFRLSTFVALYNPRMYEATAKAWKSAREGAPSGQVQLPHVTPELDNTWSVFLAVTCNDVEWPEDPATYKKAIAADSKVHPLFGAAAANIMPCAFWRSGPSEAPVAIDDGGPTNVLITQNQRDPVTPLRNAELVHEEFGDRSRLLTVDNSGHGAYVLGKNPCADDVIGEYLVTGSMPTDGFACGAA